MKVIQVENQVEGGKIAFELLKEKLAAGAQVLGLATGSSPIEFYKQIVASDLDLSGLISINLDEYVGIDEDNPQSYHHFMNEHLFDAKPFKVSYLPDGANEADGPAAVGRYNKILSEHPIDLQILGIGTNGHIGFNEPGTPFTEETHLVDLDQSTIEANARFFEDVSQVPIKAISMGIKNIMDAKSIILFAYGASKQEAIKGLVEGPVTEQLPASILQRHPDVVIIGDAEALAKLNR
ncbi:glucosamine-6-phosphate deaminase [Streptococcus massiliensis]|uniref:Glucosamine-6-phosphate deaminase n=1 Tax=Streptococcus massiliensis TaxID=313439 RepID=A0A380KYX4_9STRE|nr:glucosamine-6-phosphate deaminase [Streptococcus massiliensis]SUN76835.1 6-phosphogluconolactonase/Glucosamine-6-phosphateisomerase/deaminase [Streptococcus massiliensis]